MNEPIFPIDAPADSGQSPFCPVMEATTHLIDPAAPETAPTALQVFQQGPSAPDSVTTGDGTGVKHVVVTPAQSSADAAAETDQTDKTDVSPNSQFLQAIFGDATGQRTMVVSFPGHPQHAGQTAWRARSWHPDRPLRTGNNNYFALSTFRPADGGTQRRRKRDFDALHGIVLDDVGGKVDASRLSLPPSWQIETSAGSYQFGYILAKPLTDEALADRLTEAVIGAGLCEPGAVGTRSRLARLPEGINGRYDPPFACRLIEWMPGRRYTTDQIINGLQLDLSDTRSGAAAAGVRGIASLAPGTSRVLTLPTENPVLSALQASGLYKGILTDGRHDITCPWAAEHTSGADHGTAYFEPSENRPVGGFRCMHFHGDQYRIGELLRFLNVSPAAARVQPIIRNIPGEMDRVVDAAEQALARTGRYFQRGGMIVSIATDPGTRSTTVQAMSQAAVRRALSGTAVWERYDGRSGEWVSCDPPTSHSDILYDDYRYPHLPVLNGLARQPYLRPDGTLSRDTGYDRQTGMFGTFSAGEFNVEDAPSREDAARALCELGELISEFPFASESDRSTALSAILTATVRASLPTAPMFHVRAPQISTGKSYLCELITLFATPGPGIPTGFPADDEECRKLLLAELLQAPAVIEFDNLNGDLLPHKSLCTALTSEYMQARILGVSKTATVSTRTLLLSSGNNVGPVADMTRRCVTINLDPGCETPATRTFARPDLINEVRNNRGRFVSAALTVIRAYLAAGSPETACKPLASYTKWTNWCRRPLLWLGLPDPATSVFEGMDEDPDREMLGRLLATWNRLFGTEPTMVRDMKRRLLMGGADTEDLREVLEEIAGDRDGINSRRLGRWIKRHAGRIVDGMKLVRGSGKLNAESWRIVSVQSV